MADPPRPPNRLARHSITDEVAPGAVRDPSTGGPPPEGAATVPPPAPDRRPPPVELSAPRQTRAGLRLPGLRATPARPFVESTELTIAGLGPRVEAPRTPDDWDEDTAIRSADTLSLELAERNAEIARLKADALTRQAKLAEPPTPLIVPSVPPIAPERIRQFEVELERKQKRGSTLKRFGEPIGKFIAALTGFIVAVTATVRLVNDWLEPRIKNVEAKQTTQGEVIKPAVATAASADKSADACRAWARATDEYYRQVFRQVNVVIPDQPNAPRVLGAKEFEVDAPMSWPRAAIVVKTQPPPLP